MRFQQDCKVYDTDKARHIFTDPVTDHGYYVTPGGQYFTAFYMQQPAGWQGRGLFRRPKFENRPWGHRVTLATVQAKAFDLGLDLPSLGLEPLPEAE